MEGEFMGYSSAYNVLLRNQVNTSIGKRAA